MKLHVAAFCLALVCADMVAAPPEFDGVMASQGVNYFALRPDPSRTIKWIKLGDSLGDYILKSYDQEKETLSLSRNGESVEVVLKTGSVRSAPRSGPTIELLKGLKENGDVSQTALLNMLTSLRDRRDETARQFAELEARAMKESEPKKTEMLTQFRRKLELEEANLEYYMDKVIANWRDESRPSK
jgi:hypothetical protein